MLENYLYWQKKDEIGLVVKSFLDGVIDGEEFSDSIFGLRYGRMKLFDQDKLELASEKLKNFQLDPRAHQISSFLSFCFIECDYFDDDYTNPDFYNLIEKAFRRYQEILDEE